MAASTIDAPATARPHPPRRGRRWLAAAAVLVAAAAVSAVLSTHATLSADEVGSYGVLPGSGTSLTEPTAAQYRHVFPTSQGYSQVLWASRPGGEFTFGFAIHNGGPVPVTLLGLSLRILDPGINVLAPAGVLHRAGLDHQSPFHPVSLGPGATVYVGLTERVICPAIITRDARDMASRGQQDTSYAGDATTPVIVRYRVAGLTMSQTLSLGQPLLIMLPYTACR
jgi:hypothetical protein